MVLAVVVVRARRSVALELTRERVVAWRRRSLAGLSERECVPAGTELFWFRSGPGLEGRWGLTYAGQSLFTCVKISRHLS